MSFMSTSENVGFSGIPQTISEASCATQYKMAVEGVSGNCTDVNMFIHDSSGDEHVYIPHLNDNFFHTKFKIDPNELYTFNDSDVIASEITVGHTEDVFNIDTVDLKTKLLSSPKELEVTGILTNGEIKQENECPVVANGHYPPVSNKLLVNKETRVVNTKVLKGKSPNQYSKEPIQTMVEARRNSAQSPQGHNNSGSVSPNSNITSQGKSTTAIKSSSETFLDVFKREQGVLESTEVKLEPSSAPPLPPVTLPAKPTPAAKKTPAAKASAQSKSRKGRGPAVHEALQRIPQWRAVPVRNRTWHAPGNSLFDCGPLETNKPPPFRPNDSSSDDDVMPDFGHHMDAVGSCEEGVSRGARLAARRAALRRHVARAHAAAALADNHAHHQALAALIKKQIAGQGPSCRLPSQTVNHLLAMRGMTSVLTSQERRRLRENGWSGGEGGVAEPRADKCGEAACGARALVSARHCLAHVAAGEQRLYAACSAVFAGGARCSRPLLPLRDHSLCPEHAWKRDNYDKLTREWRPRKAVRARAAAAPRRAKRRRRAPPRPRQPSLSVHPPHSPQPNAAQTQTRTLSADHSLAEINVCSTSSAYDSCEEPAGARSGDEYAVPAGNSHQLEEVGQVPPDDILDPSVLGQMPDEAFTEFFNQAESGGSFDGGSELAAALEAVLDEHEHEHERALGVHEHERPLDVHEGVLDVRDCVFTHHVDKVHVPAALNVEMSSSASS